MLTRSEAAQKLIDDVASGRWEPWHDVALRALYDEVPVEMAPAMYDMLMGVGNTDTWAGQRIAYMFGPLGLKELLLREEPEDFPRMLEIATSSPAGSASRKLMQSELESGVSHFLYRSFLRSALVSLLRRNNAEHSLGAVVGSLLVGDPSAAFRVFDGMPREEVYEQMRSNMLLGAPAMVQQLQENASIWGLDRMDVDIWQADFQTAIALQAKADYSPWRDGLDAWCIPPGQLPESLDRLLVGCAGLADKVLSRWAAQATYWDVMDFLESKLKGVYAWRFLLCYNFSVPGLPRMQLVAPPLTSSTRR